MHVDVASSSAPARYAASSVTVEEAARSRGEMVVLVLVEDDLSMAERNPGFCLLITRRLTA